jgi:serine/threonine protein kinase
MPEPSDFPTQSLPSGSRLEEFVIERVLGSGGFGITYLARDSRLGRKVVIKENLPVQFCWRDTQSLIVRPRNVEGEDAGNFQYSLESFAREASTLASLDHPGIVKVLRSFEAHGTACFVMPFVEGVALDEVIAERRKHGQHFTEDEITQLLTKMLDTLGYLHDRGIYHRDLKPGNILMTKAGPVLIDFGAARQRLSERSLTVIESSGYTPFEQLQSRGKIGPWSDFYAMGATLYKAICGETPAKAADRAFDDPELPLTHRTELRTRYSTCLLASIDKAMSPKARDRFQNAAEWLEQVQPRASMPLPSPVEVRARAFQKPSAVVQTTYLSDSLGSSGAGGWFYKKTSHQAFSIGPLSCIELVARIRAGLLKSEAFVLNQEEPVSSRKWRKVRDVPQLRIALKSSGPVSTQNAGIVAQLQNVADHPTRPDTRWYYKTGPRARIIGPFPHRKMIARIMTGLVKPDHLVSDEEEPKTWKQVHAVPELAFALKPSSNP